MLLAIDTATQIISLALHDGGALLAENTWNTGNHHTTDLAPALQELLRHSGSGMDVISAVAVSTGPGSFSGLRIGIALAKGIAAARHLPLIGVSSLDTLAAGTPYYNGVLFTVLQAGRSRLIVKTYRWRKGRWGGSKDEEPELMDWQTLIGKVDGATFITGEIDSVGQATLAAAHSSGVNLTIIASPFRLRRAGFLAEEAWTLLKENDNPQMFEPAKLVPVYIKTKDIPG